MSLESEPIIQIKGLKKVFNTPKGEVTALDGIDLDIEKGEIFGIIGLSGAGKSTLVRCMNFLEQPTEGQVFFDGEELGALKHKELRKARRKMSMIFQQFNLLMQRTALENICMPLEIAGVSKKEAAVKATELLKVVGLSDRAGSYPAMLSGGQKQRVAIARALATDPKVLLCDEATSALDPSTTKSILTLLKKINKEMGVTIVVITHEMKVIEEICTRVAIIDQSRIAEMGDVDEVFMKPHSQVAKKLFVPNDENLHIETDRECLRIVFDGEKTEEPILANLILDCNSKVSILAANTRTIKERMYGQMIIALPDDENTAQCVRQYLKKSNVRFEEVEHV